METVNSDVVLTESVKLQSKYLKREVIVDFYLPVNIANPPAMPLLLINDGQNLEEMKFTETLSDLIQQQAISPVFCAGIHCSSDRKMEYGIAAQKDYLGRGAKAGAYTKFIREELIHYIKKTYAITSFAEQAFAGFSLGGLSALDMVWNYPQEFKKAGVFSGSLWWRSLDQEDEKYSDDKHRIMHQQIRKGKYQPGLRFFFQSGNMDETNDRNNNGIIDSIDDTLDLIKELTEKGYNTEDIFYYEMANGKHDVPTWGKAMPVFLKWGWGNQF